MWNKGFCHSLCLGIIWKEPFLPTIPNYGLATGRNQLSGGRREAHLTSVLTGKAAICTVVQYYLYYVGKLYYKFGSQIAQLIENQLYLQCQSQGESNQPL